MSSPPNERMELCLESNHNPDGTPRPDDSGVHSRRYSYDANGNLEYEFFLGVDGKIRRDRNRVAMIRHFYDSRKNEIRREFLDENRQPCLNKNGVAGWELKYDAGGKKQEEIYFGIDGRVKKNGNGPLYLQLVDWVLEEISAGNLRPGDRLDSVREISEKHGTNPNTVQRALTLLEEQGVEWKPEDTARPQRERGDRAPRERRGDKGDRPRRERHD